MCFKRLFQGRLHLVRDLPDRRSLLWSELTDATHHLRERAAAPEVVNTPGIEGRQIGDVVQACQRLCTQRLQLPHQWISVVLRHASLHTAKVLRLMRTG